LQKYGLFSQQQKESKKEILALLNFLLHRYKTKHPVHGREQDANPKNQL